MVSIGPKGASLHALARGLDLKVAATPALQIGRARAARRLGGALGMALKTLDALLIAVSRARGQADAAAQDVAARVAGTGVAAPAAAARALGIAAEACVAKRVEDRRGHGGASRVAHAIVEEVTAGQAVSSRLAIAAQALRVTADALLGGLQLLCTQYAVSPRVAAKQPQHTYIAEGRIARANVLVVTGAGEGVYWAAGHTRGSLNNLLASSIPAAVKI